MKTPEYIILTPTYPPKLYCFERFIKNVISFRPKPKEVVFCTEPEMVPDIAKWEKELKKQEIKLIIFTLGPEILDIPDAIEKLNNSREHLRKYFVNSPFDWALWLDSDIIPEPNVAQVLLDIAQSEKCLVVTNVCASRVIEKHISGGLQCAVSHKEACRFVRFLSAYWVWNGKRGNCLGEELWFYAMLSIADSHIKKRSGWTSQQKDGRFVSTWHLSEDKPRTKFLKRLKKDYSLSEKATKRNK